MSDLKILLLGATSMMTPLGDSVTLVNTSIAAGICRYRETDIHGTEENPSRMAVVPLSALRLALDPKKKITGKLLAREMRVLRLATLALNGMLDQLPEEPVPLFLAGPETYVGDPVLSGGFMKNLVLQTGANLDLANSRFVNSGRAGAFDVIETAFKYLSVSDKHFALVGGADSFYDAKTMNYLDSKYRLAKPDTIDGFVPGEGACFLLLVSPNAPEEIKNGLTACVARPGSAFEEGHLMSDEDYSGESLSTAFAQTLNGLSKKIGRIYSSENSEMHYAKELSVALTRHRKSMKENVEIVRPAEYFGDLGAAFGLVALGLGSVNLLSEEYVLAYCSSDSGPRTSVCMSLV